MRRTGSWKTPHGVSEATEAGLHQISDRLDAKLSAFMEILKERMDDNTLSRVETVKSRVSQLLSPKDTPEYTKLNVDYNDLSKKLASAQEDLEKETNRLKEVIRQCQAECREKDEITVKLRDELNNSRTECSENLQMVQGYKKLIGEEIEKNVKSENQIEALKKELAAKEEALKKHEELGREIYQKACVCEKEDATENQDEERHKEEDSVQNVEEQASEEVNDENTAKEDFEVVELTSC
uniref:IF rod domain-containing protein n=1 Tax=Bursaphelenchus xylophilus TaxID=6326 RepID=A0A1I7S9M5_BURXY